ncbi:MAG: DNA cytosine methyltransferase, partial [Pseudomonadota bacterium]
MESFGVVRGKLHRSVALRDGSFVRTKLPVEKQYDLESVVDLTSVADHAYLTEKSPPLLACDGQEVRVVDLYCGVGGMSLGVREACRALQRSFVPVLAVDADESALSLYSRNIGRDVATSIDLSGVSRNLERPRTATEVAITRAAGGRPDLMIAGPPCQGHSNLNNHTRRDDPKNEHYFRVVRMAELLKPRFVIIENVPTVTSDLRRSVPRAVKALQHLG